MTQPPRTTAKTQTPIGCVPDLRARRAAPVVATTTAGKIQQPPVVFAMPPV